MECFTCCFYFIGFRRLRDFIITQHPLVGTIKDFWQMIWDHNVQTIVLLSSIDDMVFSLIHFLFSLYLRAITMIRFSISSRIHNFGLMTQWPLKMIIIVLNIFQK